MAITQALGRLGGTLAAIVRTRLALAALEMEEESRRLLGYLLFALLALFLSGVAIVLLAFFVIVLFWDTHRIAALLGTAGVFALAALAIVLKLRADLRNKPRLLSHTIAELAKDIDFVKNAGHPHES